MGSIDGKSTSISLNSTQILSRAHLVEDMENRGQKEWGDGMGFEEEVGVAAVGDGVEDEGRSALLSGMG